MNEFIDDKGVCRAAPGFARICFKQVEVSLNSYCALQPYDTSQEGAGNISRGLAKIEYTIVWLSSVRHFLEGAK